MKMQTNLSTASKKGNSPLAPSSFKEIQILYISCNSRLYHSQEIALSVKDDTHAILIRTTLKYLL